MLSARSVVFLCLVGCLVATTEARSLSALFRKRPRALFVCRGPPDGVPFAIDSLIPNPDGNGFTLFANSTISFTKIWENAYSGKGVTGFTDPALGGQVAPVQLLAILDPRSCILTGSVFIFQAQVNEVFRLEVRRDTMVGDYISFSNNTLRFDRFARLEARMAV